MSWAVAHCRCAARLQHCIQWQASALLRNAHSGMKVIVECRFVHEMRAGVLPSSWACVHTCSLRMMQDFSDLHRSATCRMLMLVACRCARQHGGALACTPNRARRNGQSRRRPAIPARCCIIPWCCCSACCGDWWAFLALGHVRGACCQLGARSARREGVVRKYFCCEALSTLR